MRHLHWLLCALLSAMLAFAYPHNSSAQMDPGDMDKVRLPSGTPLEWMQLKNVRALYENETTLVKPEEKPDEPKKPDPNTDTNNQKIILEKAVPAQEKIVAYSQPRETLRAIMVDSDQLEQDFEWFATLTYSDPEISKSLRYLCGSQLLRMLVHGETGASLGELMQNMILLGEPLALLNEAAPIDKMESGNSLMLDTVKEALDAIGEPDTELPEPPKGSNDTETYLNKIIVRELGGDYAHVWNANFGAHLEDFGPQILKRIAQVADETGSAFIRRNAVFFLAHYEGAPEVEWLLHKALKGKDKVARNRALNGLIARGDKTIVPWLIDQLRGDDFWFRNYAAYALGKIGDESATRALLELGAKTLALLNEKNGNTLRNRDILWSLVPALGRLGARIDSATHKEITTLLQAVAEQFKGVPLELLCRAALARAGVASEIQWVMQTVKNGAVNALKPQLHFLAIEALALHAASTALEVVKNDNIELDLRLTALADLTMTPEMTDALAEIVKNRNNIQSPPALKGVALARLYVQSKNTAVELAASALASYATDNPDAQPGTGLDALTALRLLDMAGKIDHSTVLNALLRAVVDENKIKKAREEGDPAKSDFSTPVPILQECIKLLGLAGYTQAHTPLMNILHKTENAGRAYAAQALGQFKDKELVRQAVPLLYLGLFDRDRWVRASCAWSLEKLLEHNVECDWLYDNIGKRTRARLLWKEYLVRNKYISD